MNSLDSRNLGYTDTYAKRFAEPGQVRYRLGSATHGCVPLDPQESTYAIEVRRAPRPDEPTQHDVSVSRGPSGDLAASPAQLTVSAGDVVLWHASDGSVPAFVVQGEGENGGGFDSTLLNTETMYTHAFGLPGHYEWADAYDGQVRGVVRVHELDRDDRGACEKWRALLSEGTLVLIEGDRVEPAEVDILAGQTVAFAVARSTAGITVTERALLESQGAHAHH